MIFILHAGHEDFVNYVGARSIGPAVRFDVWTSIANTVYQSNDFSRRKRAQRRDMRKYQTEHGVALVTWLWSSFRNLIRDSEHGASITTKSYYSVGLSRRLLLGSRSPRRDEKRFLPKSIPRQNGASYPLDGEKREEEKGDPRWPASLLNTCLCTPAANKWAHDVLGNFSGSVKLGREDGKLIWRLS